MTYRVDWTTIAEDHLADIWLAAADRGAVTAAAAWLEAELARDPLRLGDPLDASVHRVASFGPLAVEFEVIEDDKRVIVNAAFEVA